MYLARTDLKERLTRTSLSIDRRLLLDDNYSLTGVGWMMMVASSSLVCLLVS